MKRILLGHFRPVSRAEFGWIARNNATRSGGTGVLGACWFGFPPSFNEATRADPVAGGPGYGVRLHRIPSTSVSGTGSRHRAAHRRGSGRPARFLATEPSGLVPGTQTGSDPGRSRGTVASVAPAAAPGQLQRAPRHALFPARDQARSDVPRRHL